MGNPGPQPRSNGSKPNSKPKHRHSGSVSSISLSSEDLQPKHRHSGSVSNISLSSEDLKPRHRHSGSVSNISLSSEDLKPKHRHSAAVSNIPFAPEDLKPNKHRRSGSASSISLTPEDLKPQYLRHSGPLSNGFNTPEDRKPKHRYSGSVSSININSDDFSSPIRGDTSSSSLATSIPSSSASLKEKRLKRRTRSSLGGAEDFIKELDFLTPPSNGKTADRSARKELLKPSPSPPFSESAALPAASEALAPVQEAPTPALVERLGENVPEDGANGVEVEKDDGGNGGPFEDDKFVTSLNESVHPGDSGRLAVSKVNGVDSKGTVEADDDGAVLYEDAEHGSSAKSTSVLGNGHHPVDAALVPVVRTLTDESDSTELASADKVAKDVPEADVAERSAPGFLASDIAGASVSLNAGEQQGFTDSNNSEPQLIGGIVPPHANGESQAEPSTEEPSRDEQGSLGTEEEKVSVQKRIEMLEKIAGGRPVHFRSQSLSFSRTFDISHAKHHEAEASNRFKMPAYKAPLDWASSISEMDSSDWGGAFLEDLNEEAIQSEEKASTEVFSSTTASAFPDNNLAETGPPNISQNEEIPETPAVRSLFNEQQETPAVESSFSELSEESHPQVPKSPEEAELAPESFVSDMHPSGTTAEALESFSADKGKSIEESEIPSDARAHAMEPKASEPGTAEGKESDLGDAHIPASEDSVPEEMRLAHSEALTKETTGTNGEVEPPTAGVSVEQHPQAAQAGTVLAGEHQNGWPEAASTGTLPVTHETGASSEVPYAQASMDEQDSQDYETAMLLTKQPAVDPLFVDSQQDRLWEMHSQELSIEGESSGNEVRESSAQDYEPRQYVNGSSSRSEVAPACSAPNGSAQSHKSGKVDRPRTPLRSLLAEEDAEKCPDSGARGTPPQNHSGSPKSNLFKRIVSGGKGSPTKQNTPTKFSPKSQPAAKPFLSSCMCCSAK